MYIFFKKKKFAKGLDRTALTGSCGPTPVLIVHGINKKSGYLGLKNRFSFLFPVFTVRPPGPVRFWKPCFLFLWFFPFLFLFVSSLVLFTNKPTYIEPHQSAGLALWGIGSSEDSTQGSTRQFYLFANQED